MNTVGIYKLKPDGRRKKFWAVRWFGEPGPDGKARRYSKSFTHKAAALGFKSEKEHEIRKTGRPDGCTRATLDRLCRDFLETKRGNVKPATIELYENTVGRLFDNFGSGRTVTDITRRDADLFVAAQLRQDNGRELSAWKRAQIITHCRCIFRVAVRWGMARENPFDETEKPRPRVHKWHHLRPAEFLRLLDAAPDLRRRALYSVLYLTGLRIGEALSLTWADIDFDRGEVRVQNRPGSKTMPPFTLKAHERRVVPAPKHALDILAELHAEAAPGNPYALLAPERYQRILNHWRKLGMVDAKWRPDFVMNNGNRDFKSHVKRGEIDPDGKLSIHTLRKSFGQNHALSGTPIKTLQYLMGHSNERTTLKFYQAVDAASAAAATARLDALLTDAKANCHDRGQAENADLSDAGKTRESCEACK
jgi:integrase